MPASETPPTRWTLAENLVIREVGGQVFILMPDSTMHILENASAVHLYRALEASADAGTTISELVHGLQAHFQVSEPQAREDAAAFVTRLEESGVARGVAAI